MVELLNVKNTVTWLNVPFFVSIRIRIRVRVRLVNVFDWAIIIGFLYLCFGLPAVESKIW